MFAARLHVALEFERGVIDPQFAEPCAERLLQLRHPLQIVYRYVRRQGVLSRTERPDVEMVHPAHTRLRRHRAEDLVVIDPRGNAVQRQPQAVAQQPPYQPVAIMTAPDTIPPTDTSASAAMCR